MDEVAVLRAEAARMGYVSPLPGVLRTALPSKGEIGGDGQWAARFRLLTVELPGWVEPQRRLLASGALDALAQTLDSRRVETRAPLPDRIFRALAEVPLDRVRVVFLGQDPYPSTDRLPATLRAINKLSHEEVTEILGEGYENWEMVRPTPWENGDSAPRPRVRIGAVPYAIGKSFAYPAICADTPASYKNLREAVRKSTRGELRMDSELTAWAEQGVLMLNACPVLYGNGASGRNPNVWTAWTSEILGSIARENPYCVFVLLGNSAKAFKKDIVTARAEACIIETGHPSSRSSSLGSFLGSDIFRRINEFFESIAANVGASPRVVPIRW
jgi:uracil DNA glycosylase